MPKIHFLWLFCGRLPRNKVYYVLPRVTVELYMYTLYNIVYVW